MSLEQKNDVNLMERVSNIINVIRDTNKKSYPTPHINATPEDFAKTVLMPGDPLRSKFIADTFLKNAKLINNVRGIQGYTGLYKDTPVSVMASGMGMPSIGIYSYELFNFFGVENIIRIGSAGALKPNIDLNDIIIAMGACTNSSYANQFNLNGTFAPIASYNLLEKAIKNAEKTNAKYHIGNVISTDTFYNNDKTFLKQWSNMNVLASEMEAAALYMNAAKANKNALAICTISDNLVTGEELDAKKREKTFINMIKIALEVAAESNS